MPTRTPRDPVISADGGSVAFVSLADDLVTPDTNGATDVFAVRPAQLLRLPAHRGGQRG